MEYDGWAQAMFDKLKARADMADELAGLVVDVYLDKRFEALDDELKNRVRVSVLNMRDALKDTVGRE